MHGRGQLALREERQELVVGLERIVLVPGLSIGVGHQELRVIGGRIAGELAHHAAELVGRVVPVLVLIEPLGDLEARVRGEGAGRILLDQLLERRTAGRALAEPIEGPLRAAGCLTRRRAARVLLDHPRKTAQGVGVVPGVVVALRQTQGRERGGRAGAEVAQQALVAALRLGVALRLEVDVAGASPCALGERILGAGGVAHDRLPAIDRVAGALEAQIAETRLVQRQGAARMLGIAAQEVLVGRGRLRVTLLVEPLVGDVEEGRAHHLLVAARAVPREQPLFGRDRQAVLALARLRPRQQLGGRRADRMIGEVAHERFESLLRFGIPCLRGRGVGVDQQRVRAPRRVARRHLLEQEMRRARELAEVARTVIAELEQTERRFDQLLVLGLGEHDAAAVVLLGITVQHDLEIRRGGERLVLIHQPHARQIRGRGSFGLERIAGHHRLVAAGRVRAASHRIERAGHTVLRARRHLVLEVLRQHAIELDDRLLRLALRNQRLTHQELRAGGHVTALLALGHAAQQRDRRVRASGQEHGARRTQLGLGAHLGILDASRHAAELLGRALVVTRFEERVRLGEQRVIPQRGIGIPLPRFLEGGRRLEQRALRFQTQRIQIGRDRTGRLGAQRGERVVRMARQIRHRSARERPARILVEPGVRSRPPVAQATDALRRTGPTQTQPEAVDHQGRGDDRRRRFSPASGERLRRTCRPYCCSSSHSSRPRMAEAIFTRVLQLRARKDDPHADQRGD